VWIANQTGQAEGEGILEALIYSKDGINQHLLREPLIESFVAETGF
jgi:hypothetical protein